MNLTLFRIVICIYIVINAVTPFYYPYYLCFGAVVGFVEVCRGCSFGGSGIVFVRIVVFGEYGVVGGSW